MQDRVETERSPERSARPRQESPPRRSARDAVVEPVCTAVKSLATRSWGLTAAEARVLRELLQGRTRQEIASKLGLSVETVRTQVKSLFRKLGVGGARELWPSVLCLLMSPTSATLFLHAMVHEVARLTRSGEDIDLREP